eukprot:11825017-Ditylum_brightwellii.AAC.1
MEFNIGQKDMKFLSKDKLLWVIHRMAIANNSLYVKSIQTDEIWWEDKTIPSGETFKEEFKLWQEVNQAGSIT